MSSSSSTGRPVGGLARVVDSAEFTVAFGWWLAFVGVAAPLLVVCLRHAVAGELLTACAAATVSIPLAGLSIQRTGSRVRTAFRRHA